jgi:hypothetical protein
MKPVKSFPFGLYFIVLISTGSFTLHAPIAVEDWFFAAMMPSSMPKDYPHILRP